jgi:hypothetical protein
MSALKYWDTTSGTWKYLAQGVKGDTGNTGIVSQATPPSNTDVVWLDTSVAGASGSVPVAGTVNQVLAKLSDADYDTEWVSRGAGTVTSITATSPLTGGTITNTGTIGIQSASTSQTGAVQLVDSVTSASVDYAATPKSVKTAYDLATTANTAATAAQATANTRLTSVSAADGTITVSGDDTAPTLAVGTVPAGQVSGLATSATTNTTVASNITSGLLPAARITGTVVDASIDTAGLAQSSLNGVAITEWAASTTYAKGALVNYLGIVYRRISAGTTGSTFVGTNWHQVTPTIPALQSPPISTWIGTGARGSLSGDQTNVGGDLHVVPFVINTPRTLDAVAVLTGTSNVGTAGTVGRIGIWSTDANGVPTTLVRDCGTVPLTAAASVQQISGLAQALPTGMYWIGCVVQNAGAVIPLMVTNVSSTVLTPFSYTFQSTATTATNLDFNGQNTYRSSAITGTFASTPPTFIYNSNAVSPIKVIWKFSA